MINSELDLELKNEVLSIIKSSHKNNIKRLEHVKNCISESVLKGEDVELSKYNYYRYLISWLSGFIKNIEDVDNKKDIEDSLRTLIYNHSTSSKRLGMNVLEAEKYLEAKFDALEELKSMVSFVEYEKNKNKQ